MKQYFTKISIILLALLVLITSTGFKVYEHYCYSCNIKQFSLTNDFEKTCKIETNEVFETEEPCCKKIIKKFTKQTNIINNICCFYDSKSLKLNSKFVFSEFKLSFISVFILQNYLYKNIYSFNKIFQNLWNIPKIISSITVLLKICKLVI